MHAPYSLRKIVSLLSLIAVVAGWSIAKADDYADVSRLMRSRQFPEAMSKVEQLLSAKPRDAQLRFFRGVIQNEMGKISEATSTFLRLTEDHPELPEPYNNLAVIYANAGQFDKSRAALEMAIRTNPSYATAHENLGDIYAKLASQSYAKALQLDNTNTAIQPKLAIIKDLFTPALGKAAPAPTPTPAPAPSTLPQSPSPATVTPAPSTPIVAAVMPKVPTIVTASPNGTNQPNVAPAIVAGAAASGDVEAAVHAWAQAWSERNMKAYFASYSKDFVSAGKKSHEEWAEERRTRIMGKNKIVVKLTNLTSSVKGNTAMVTFRQDYKADSLATNSRKTLELVKSGDRWVITKEVTG